MTTPQQAFQTLTQELAASASEPLLDNDGSKFTLRGAIGRILWKVNFLLPLSQRPVDPKLKDDLYGHVLSLRAENLITQAILADLASRLGTDVPKIITDAKAAFNVTT
jgi:hypothetical protein